MKKFVSKLLVLLMTVSIVVPQFMTAKASAATYMNDCQIGSGSIDLYDDKGNESTFKLTKVLTKYVGRGGDVVVPDGIQIIGYGAFMNCTNVTSITLPDSLLYIDGEAFENTGISNIVIPKNVKVVYGYSFALSKKLSFVVFLCKDFQLWDDVFDNVCNLGCILYGYTGNDAWDYVANELHPVNVHFKDIKYVPASLLKTNTSSSVPAHGSLTLDTSSYSMPSGKTYQIGAKVTSNSTYLKVYSTNSGIASVNSSNYKVTGRGNGTAWIIFDVYDSSTNKRLVMHLQR